MTIEKTTDRDAPRATREVTTTRPKGYGAYSCYLCRRELNAAGVIFNDTLAAIRVFSGVPGQGQSLAGGYAACDRHAPEAIEKAMTPLVSAALKNHKYPQGWQVVAYRVELDGHGAPRLGKRLFVCRERVFEESPSNMKLMTPQ